jgi:hypothetical protein
MRLNWLKKNKVKTQAVIDVNDDEIENFEIVKIPFDNLEFEIRVHRANSNRIIIMYPGADGSIDGYNNKYRKIASMIQSRNIANVIRLDNQYCIDGLPYVEMMISKIAHMIDHVYNNSFELVGIKRPEICLSGISAGAGAIAVVLEEFPFIKKVLFISPAESVGREIIVRGLKKYQGELYLTAGDNDEIGADKIAAYFHDSCATANHKEFHLISKCDHQFTGKKNGQILSNAFLWAFANSGNFPSHRGGLPLY